MKKPYKTLTKELVANMEPETYNAIRNAYYRTAEGINMLSETSAALGTEEQEALKSLQAAIAKLKNLGILF